MEYEPEAPVTLCEFDAGGACGIGAPGAEGKARLEEGGARRRGWKAELEVGGGADVQAAGFLVEVAGRG